MLRSRRLALVAAAALIGLSGCGDAAPRTTAAKAPAVIHLGAAPAGNTTESATADRMMMPMRDVTFVFDGSAPELGTEAMAWTLPASAQVDPARIAEIARLLGVEGEVRAVAADQGGGWMVGAADYSTATLTVSADALSSWWFNPSPAVFVTTSCVEPSASAGPEPTPIDGTTVDGTTVDGTTVDGTTVDGTTVDDTTVDDTTVVDPATGGTATSDTTFPDCAEPAPPANVPDEAAALAAARQLFSDMGYDTTAYDYETYADEWSANVTAFLLLDGHRSPISMSVGFGADGAVTWASGSFATPQSAATYPLVGVDVAVARLNDDTGRWMGSWGGPNVMARMGATGTGEATVADVAPAPQGAPTEPGSTGTASTASPDIAITGAEPIVPEDPTTPVEPITVHLTGATLALTMVWAEDGTIWMLPAYTFTADDGGSYSVIAVDESFVDLPAPFPTESLPIEAVTVETVPVESMPIETVTVDSIAVDDSSVVAVTSIG